MGRASVDLRAAARELEAHARPGRDFSAFALTIRTWPAAVDSNLLPPRLSLAERCVGPILGIESAEPRFR